MTIAVDLGRKATKPTNVCYMTFVYVRDSHKVRYLYGICDVQVPIFRAL